MEGTGGRRLEGRIALVTGAGSGIGAACARRLAAEGATLILADRDRPRVEAVLTEIGEGADHTCATMDVTIERDWVRTLEALEERHGHLDILVNNAGWSRLLPMSDCSLEDWREIVSVNLDAAFLGMKLSMPMLAASTGGAIVNMSSIRSDLAGVGASAYSAAKSGMAALARVVAIECAQADNGVRVNTVHPGFVETPFSRGMATREQIDAFAGTVPIKRLAQPSEIAAVVAFLASDDASYMTGASVVVDGGFSVV